MLVSYSGRKYLKNKGKRIIPIIEGIINDLNYEEAAVNLPNKGYIEYLKYEISN